MSSYQDSVNYYTVLGVPRDASTKEINLAFKRRALKLHPDKSGGDRASIDQFCLVSCIEDGRHVSNYLAGLAFTQQLKLIISIPRHKKLLKPSATLNDAAITTSHFHGLQSTSITNVRASPGTTGHAQLQTSMKRVNGTMEASGILSIRSTPAARFQMSIAEVIGTVEAPGIRSSRNTPAATPQTGMVAVNGTRKVKRALPGRNIKAPFTCGDLPFTPTPSIHQDRFSSPQ